MLRDARLPVNGLFRMCAKRVWMRQEHRPASPSDLRGGTFANFGPGGDVCNKLINMQFSSLVCIETNKKGERLQVLRATRCWQTSLFSKILVHMNLELFSHMSFGLPGPLRTALISKTDLPASKIEPDAAISTLHALVS